MKKIKLLLVAIVALLVIPFAVNAKEKITVHIFRGEGCGYCKAALEYFDSIKDDYGKYFKLEKHEVWYDEDNAELMQKVAAYFDEEVNGVPYIIIGDKTFQGYAEQYNEQIIDAIMTAYDSGSFVDRVVQVNNGEVKVDPDNGTSETGEKETTSKNQKKDEKKEDKTIYIIIAVALVGFIALIYFARDTKDEFVDTIEEVVEEEKEEEVVEVEIPEKKETPKKTTIKKATPKKTATKKPASKKTTTKKTTTKSKSTKK